MADQPPQLTVEAFVAVVDCAALFDYEAADKEWPRGCNLCDSPISNVMRQRDRYGYPVGVTACQCGLVYINPRMSAAEYRRFYESGVYRRLVSAFHGREINAETIQPEQRKYAEELADFLAPHVGGAETLLDVGGSTGVVARVLSERYGLSATVLDPATEELVHANGLSTLRGQVEDVDIAGRYDLITLCQTVDHLLDIAGTLRKLRDCLTRPGLLFVDAVDFNRTREIKIDHPFNLTEDTMASFLARAGLVEVARDRAPDGVHVRFLCGR